MGYGVGIIATILHDAGHEVKVVDNNSVYRRYSDDQLVSQIRDFNPDVLGHGITMPSAIHHYRLSARIREEFPDLPQIAGGLHLKGAYEEVLRHNIDIACVREGEKLILPLVEHIASAKQRGVPLTQGLEVIDGLAYLGSDLSGVVPISALFVAMHFSEATNGWRQLNGCSTMLRTCMKGMVPFMLLSRIIILP